MSWVMKRYEIEDFEKGVVNEAVAEYVKTVNKTSPLKVAYKNISYKDFFNDKMLVVHSIRTGITFSFFELIKKMVPFSDADWANYLNLSIKSLQRYKNEANFVFKPIHSEKILEIAEVTQLGLDVFDSSEQFSLWLHTPSFALGRMKPIELLQDSYGKELVIDAINKIDYGIFS
jgi:putative toxin-antitoxin system antitoxin component (TIGR02293 family)